MFVAALHNFLQTLESRGRLGNWRCTNCIFRGQFALAETFIAESFIVEDDEKHCAMQRIGSEHACTTCDALIVAGSGLVL